MGFIQQFRDADVNTKWFVLTLAIMGVIIVGTTIFAFGFVDTRRSGAQTEQISN